MSSRVVSRRRMRRHRWQHHVTRSRARWLLLESLEVRALLAAGDLDTGFGIGGLVTTDITGTSSYDEASAVCEVGADGRLVVAGSSGSSIALVRYLENGSLDTTFGVNGKVLTTIPGGSAEVRAMVVQSDGSLVLAGSFDPTSGKEDFLVARYTSAGVLDPSFGGDGLVTTDFGSTDDIGRAVAIDSSGRIVVAGLAYASLATSNFAVRAI